MPIFTPRGLKVRLDDEAVTRVLGTDAHLFDVHDALLDVEVWENLPGASANVAAIVAAFVTRSWGYVLLAGVLAFLLANLAQVLFYSRTFQLVLPQFLGSWPIALPMSVGVGIWLWSNGHLSAGVAAVAVVLINWVGFGDSALLIVNTPLRLLVMRAKGHPFLTSHEVAFIGALNHQATRRGVRLNWNRYAAEVNDRGHG